MHTRIAIDPKLTSTSSLALVVSVLLYFSTFPSIDTIQNLPRMLIGPFLIQSPVPYSSYVPGGTDEERWNWLTKNMEKIRASNRQQIEAMFNRRTTDVVPKKTLTYRITAEHSEQEAFVERFSAVRIELNLNQTVDRVEIIPVTLEHGYSM